MPGKPDESDLIFRIESDDPELHMPPRKCGKPLTADQVAVIRRWVEQGASWTEHWAFKPPQKPELPAVKNPRWPVNAIDRFLLARLEAEGLVPEPEADKTALIRRVTLDLTGLPPTLQEVDAFLKDRSGTAYETVVNRLLDSPRYGEHQARFWLDAARYGDTHGLHLDNYREIWPYRDWVIRAFNAQQAVRSVRRRAACRRPAPQPDPRPDRRHRIQPVPDLDQRGGSIEEEVYVRNIVDQVDTNGTVFMGLSTGCARCHDHKFDPIRAKDYYQLFAFFNNIDGPALDGNSAKWAPIVPVPTPAQRDALAALDGEIASLRKEIAAEAARAAAAYDPGPTPRPARKSAGPISSGSTTPCRRAPSPKAIAPGSSSASRAIPSRAAGSPSGAPPEGSISASSRPTGDKLKTGEGDTLFAHVYLDRRSLPRK